MRIGTLGLGVCLVVAAFGPAVAQQPTQAQASAIRSSCRADYQAHCASVPTGGMAALSCLQQNAASLSPACQQAVAAVGAPAGTPAQPPQAAAPPAQGAAPPPSGAAPAPLPPRQEAHILRQYCAADYRRLCAGVRPGGGAGIACLKDNAQSLSPGCQRALMSARTLR